MRSIATISKTSDRRITLSIVTNLYKTASIGKAKIIISLPYGKKTKNDSCLFACDLMVWAYDNEENGWHCLYEGLDFGKDWVVSVVEQSGVLKDCKKAKEAFVRVNQIANDEEWPGTLEGWNHIIASFDTFLMTVGSQYRLLPAVTA